MVLVSGNLINQGCGCGGLLEAGWFNTKAKTHIKLTKMREKAQTSFKEMLILKGSKNYSGAANRAYYSLYQAIVHELESKGRKPADYTNPDPKHLGKWPHGVIKNNCGEVGVERREREVVKLAQDLRVKADYEEAPVEWDEFELVFKSVEGILKGLGVTTK